MSYSNIFKTRTIFESHKKNPASVLYNILRFWLTDNLNAIQIQKELNELYVENIIDIRIIYIFYII